VYNEEMMAEMFFTVDSENLVMSCFFFLASVQFPWASATAQNGWLPILDTCGTSHFDKKMPQDGIDEA
jgi:hypothetical protein